MKEIKVTCKGVTKRVKLRELIALQKNLKVLTQDSYKKFKKNILRFGIMRPVVIWVKPSGEKCILDGHQLVNTLKVMENEGYTVPDLPVVEVEAKDEREAYARLLALASQYGELDTGGLYEVIETQVQDLQAVMQYFQFPRFDVDKFLREFYIDTDVEVIEDEETDIQSPGGVWMKSDYFRVVLAPGVVGRVPKEVIDKIVERLKRFAEEHEVDFDEAVTRMFEYVLSTW